MRRHLSAALRGRTATLLAAGCLAGAALAVPTSGVAVTGSPLPAAARSASAVVPTVALRAGTPRRYTPPAGVRFNNPLGDRAARRNILGHLIKTTDSVPGGQDIRVASWNIRSDDFVDALVRAHRRGVSVRVVVDKLNANDDNPNAGVDELQSKLKGGGSGVVRCRSACRGPRGIAHTKFFLFSRAGSARSIAMFGSANATDLAATHQWNDLYTVHGRTAVYNEFVRVFEEMMRDRKSAQPYVSSTVGPLTTYFYPYSGARATGDPVLKELGRTACAGATGGTGVNGRTKIRIAMTSWHGERGIAIAQRLKQMYNRGCNVKIVYAVMGNEVLRILRRGGRGAVPLRQIVQDFNRDGVYDRYLHMKSLAISGRYGGRGDAEVTFNGSANWTPVALASDEAGMRIYSRAVRRRYTERVDRLFANPPYNPGSRYGSADGAGRVTTGTAPRTTTTDTSGSWLPPAEVERIARSRGVDPYSRVEVD